MKFIALFATALIASGSVSGRPIRREVDPSLVPEFGIKSGVNPTGTGDCDGVNGIKIPCACPPERGAFLASLNANVAAGFAINNPTVKLSFPVDNSKASKLARLNAATVTLQNLRGPGVGCPNSATTFGAQRLSIEQGTDTPVAPSLPSPAQPNVPAPAPPANNTPSQGVDPALVPEFGVQSNVNPTGTGDCDGINGIKIPCTCPPSRESFIQSLNANLAVGHAVNNPDVKLAFPTDNSKASKLTRFHAATVTLQNLSGPGKGCPQSSTTFGAQVAAIQAGQ